MVEIAKTVIFPAAMSYLSELTSTAEAAKSLGIDMDTSVIASISSSCGSLMEAADVLAVTIETHETESTEKHMRFCADTVRGLMDDVRVHADTLETLVADDQWPLPKYREMLFIR